MSIRSGLARRWKPLVAEVLLGATEAFAINKVSSDSPSWWRWIVPVLALVGVVACAFYRFPARTTPPLLISAAGVFDRSPSATPTPKYREG